ncbi:MAG TPA: hypothetical protein VE057_18840 [Archangium sp.]|nr:hypothetical protein [Archangium sp.]
MSPRVGLLLLLCAACTPSGLSPGPTVYVQRWDAVNKCFATCGELAAPPAGFPLTQSCAVPSIPDGSTCRLSQGTDLLRVVAHYEKLEFDRLDQVTAPAVELRVDGQTQPVSAAMIRLPLSGERAQDYAAVADNVVVPAVPGRELTLVVGSDSYKTPLKAIPLDAPDALAVKVDGCDTAICPNRPAGVGEVLIEITAPKGFGPNVKLVQLWGEERKESDIVLDTMPDGLMKRFPLPVPNSPGKDWKLEGRIGLYPLPSREVRLVEPDVVFTLGDCPGNDCELVAGSGEISAVISVPAGLRERTSFLTSVIDGIEDPTPIPMDIKIREGDFMIGQKTLKAPNRPGSTWRVIAHIGSNSPVTASTVIHLRPPGNARVVFVEPGVPLAEVDFAAPPAPPQRVAGEVLDRCREVSVAVRMADAPRATVRLRASLGTFLGGVQETQAVLDSSGQVLVPMVLDGASAGRLVSVQVYQGDVVRGSASWRLGEIWPTRGELLALAPEVQVGASGSEAFSITGRLVPPSGAQFPPGTQVSLSAAATVGSSSTAAKCGRPVPVSFLDCQPGTGCLLTPRTVAVEPDGSFTVPLTQGLCFLGQVTVTAMARSGSDAPADTCLGERAISAAPTAVGFVTLQFVPASEP